MIQEDDHVFTGGKGFIHLPNVVIAVDDTIFLSLLAGLLAPGFQIFPLSTGDPVGHHLVELFLSEFRAILFALLGVVVDIRQLAPLLPLARVIAGRRANIANSGYLYAVLTVSAVFCSLSAAVPARLPPTASPIFCVWVPK